MKKLLSFTIIVIGVFLILASGLLGLGFGRIAVTDLIIQGSRESVFDLVSLVIISGLGFVIGYYLIQTARGVK